MDRPIKNVVITPDSYADQTDAFPVLYILHGASSDYRFWPTYYPDIKDFADTYQLILVFPDGGEYSWYLDSPVEEHSKYETYISNELIEAIDAKYHTIANKQGRAITGVSMGGHGAFYLAFKHPDIWGAAGSISGGLDLRPFPTNWEISERLGSYRDHPENWEKHSVFNMVYLLDPGSLKLIFDCGIDDFFYDANKRMHQKLMQRNIPHDYIERPGAHTLDYFGNSLPYHLLFFSDYFESGETIPPKK